MLFHFYLIVHLFRFYSGRKSNVDKKVIASLTNLSQHWRVARIIFFKWNLCSIQVWQTLHYLKYQVKTVYCKCVGIFIFVILVLGLI